MQVGQNAYEADVLTAIKTDQRGIFYDVVGIHVSSALPNRHMRLKNFVQFS